MQFIVTIIPKYIRVADRVYDGEGNSTCPAHQGKYCSASHGRHHSILMEADNLDQLKSIMTGLGYGHYGLVRIEEV